jgi:hypothetical protein
VWFQSSLRRQGGSEHAVDDTVETAAATTNDVTSCHSWMLMQLQMPQLMTPFFPPFCSTAQRYQALRELLPQEYAFIPEIEAGQYDLCLQQTQLLVLVHAVHSHSYCDWTVQIRDETGSTMSAWISPTLIQQERDKPDKVREGIVWCLRNVSILPEAGKRWLLIDECNIEKYWVAPKHVRDEVFLDWMDKRSRLIVPDSLNHSPPKTCTIQRPTQEAKEEEEEMEVVVVELPLATVPRPIGVQPPSQYTADKEKEALTEEQLPADFGMQILPQLLTPAGSETRNFAVPQASMTQPTVVPTSLHTTQSEPFSVAKPTSASTTQTQRDNPYKASGHREVLVPAERNQPVGHPSCRESTKECIQNCSGTSQRATLAGLTPALDSQEGMTSFQYTPASVGTKSSKQKSCSSKKKRSSKPRSTLWSAAAMMNMFDDEDEEENIVPPGFGSIAEEKVAAASIPKKSTLWSSAAAMMNIFDEDED